MTCPYHKGLGLQFRLCIICSQVTVLKLFPSTFSSCAVTTTSPLWTSPTSPRLICLSSPYVQIMPHLEDLLKCFLIPPARRDFPSSEFHSPLYLPCLSSYSGLSYNYLGRQITFSSVRMQALQGKLCVIYLCIYYRI